jgi:hypothetical protein
LWYEVDRQRDRIADHDRARDEHRAELAARDSAAMDGGRRGQGAERL